MKKILVRIALLAAMLGVCFAAGRRETQAADYATEPYPHAIGRDMENSGLRVIGISYSVDGGVREYSFDSYSKRNGTWEYVKTQINDTASGQDISNSDDSTAFITVNKRSSSKHYQVHAARLRQSVGDFSVVMHAYNKGAEVRSRKEYSFLSYSLNTGVYSMMAHNELSLGGFTAEEDSYAYNFYRPRELTAQTEVSVQAGEGKLESGGKAYYTEDGYYIRELPKASLVKPGYSVGFAGWFDAREGGTQIQEDTWYASGTTLYARWNITPLSYDVTCYDICGNSPSGKVLGEHSWKSSYGATVSGATCGDSTENGEYYKGYTFQNSTTAVVSASGAVVYRYFSEHRYQISFDGNGASLGKMEELKNCSYTQNITLTENCFQKELRIVLDSNGENATCETTELFLTQRFLGWALSPDGQVKYSDGAVVSCLADKEDNITLYAIWSEEKLTVKEKPQRFGYEFAGWALTPGALDGMTQFSVEENMTLYAVWKSGTAPYHVEYYKENLEGHYDLVSGYAFDDFVDSEVEISAEENIYPGFYLDKKSSVLSGKVRPDGSLILTVYYTRNKNQVSYHLNGGEETDLPALFDKKYGEELTLWEKTDFRKEGCVFVGWSEDPDGKNRIYVPGETIKMPNHSLVLYAVWRGSSYEVRLEANGADNAPAPQVISAAADEEIQLPVCRGVKSGYEFAGWNTKPDGTGISYSSQERVQNLCQEGENSITLYAQWSPVTYQISYVANADAAVSGKVRGTVKNTQYTLVGESYITKEKYLLDGYEFLGWNTKADGSGKMYASGENITGKLASKKDTVLYAIWKLSENFGFQIELTVEGEETPTKTIQLFGRMGEKVSEALLRIYHDTLYGEGVEYFYPGYQVVNRQELEKTILGDHTTKCSVTIKERKCLLNYGIFQQGNQSSIMQDPEYAYKGQATLKEKLEYLGQERVVGRYIDNNGKVYLPGEKISLERNITLIPQFRILLHGDGDDSDKEEYCSWGESYALPGMKKTGYEFLGWYTKEDIFAGKEQDKISGTDNVELYPKWSEPLQYRISYDVEDRVLQILENKVTQYTYLKEVQLPGKNQIVVLLEEYEFAGWYLAGDKEEKIIDKIEAGTYGDVTLMAKLVKRENLPSKDDNDKPANDKDNSTNSTGEENKNPTDGNGSADVTENPDILSQKKEPGQSLSQNKAGDDIKVGTTFWKNKVKYKITSKKKGAYTVKVMGNRYKKKQLRIPSKVSFGGKTYRVTVIGKKAFYKNKSIRKVVVPSTVHTVGTQAFANMKRVTGIIFGKNLKILGKKACYKNSSLKYVKFKSKKIKKAGKNAFLGCKKLHKNALIKKIR